jgi:hypothetical protein
MISVCMCIFTFGADEHSDFEFYENPLYAGSRAVGPLSREDNNTSAESKLQSPITATPDKNLLEKGKIVVNAPKARGINLSSCTGKTYIELEIIAAAGQAIVEQVLRIIEGNPDLERIYIEGNYSSNTTVFEDVITECIQCRYLKELTFSGSFPSKTPFRRLLEKEKFQFLESFNLQSSQRQMKAQEDSKIVELAQQRPGLKFKIAAISGEGGSFNRATAIRV